MEAAAADSISKCEWDRFDKLMPDREVDPRPIPRSFLKWLDNPFDDWNLGPNVVKDIVRMHGIKPMFPL